MDDDLFAKDLAEEGKEKTQFILQATGCEQTPAARVRDLENLIRLSLITQGVAGRAGI